MARAQQDKSTPKKPDSKPLSTLRPIGGSVSPSRPRIVIGNRQLSAAIRDAKDAWVDYNNSLTTPKYYRLGGEVVRLIEEPRIKGDFSRRIEAVTSKNLHGDMAEIADWGRLEVDEDDKEVFVPVDPHKDVIRDLIHNMDSRLPDLHGIVTSPYYSPSGDLHDIPGYRDGILLLSPGFELPSVPEFPSRKELDGEIQHLQDDLLGDFPFADTSSRTHTIALMLTFLVRQMTQGPKPLFVFTSKKPGSGKSLLADVTSLIITGKPCHPFTLTFGNRFAEEETRRKLTGILMRAQEIALLDNVSEEYAINSATLASVLTSREWQDRRIGTSDAVTISNNTIWLANGNNVRLSEEIRRRAVMIELAPMEDDPSARTGFRHANLRAWVLENRDQLNASLHMLVRGWLAAGRPKGRKVMGSFEEWSEVVGGILDVAGLPGFLEKATAPACSEFQLVIEKWNAKHGREWVTASQILPTLQEAGTPFSFLRGATPKAHISALGTYLAKAENRAANGLRIVARSDSHKKSKVYALEEVRE